MFAFNKVVSLCILLIVAGMTFAATSASIALSGSMPISSEVVVVPVISAISDLSLTSTASVVIASISAKSNNKTGYAISLSSINNWTLKETLGDNYTYILSFGGVDLDKPLGGSVDIATSSTKGRLTATDLALRFEAVSSDVLMNDGVYTDTLTIIISSK